LRSWTSRTRAIASGSLLRRELRFSSDGSVLYAERAQEFFLASARAHGLHLLEETRVLRVDARSDLVRLETPAGSIRVRAVVVTAGAWAPLLLESIGVDLATHATRETVGHFLLEGDGSIPVVLDWATPELSSDPTIGRGRLVYALPSPGVGVKVGLDRSGLLTDPDEEGQPDTEVVGCLTEWLADRFGVDSPRLARAETCIYTHTPDDRFILDRIGRVVVGVTCNGHGFKFAPLTGTRLAALAMDAAV
jgi:sarcosine oxidase